MRLNRLLFCLSLGVASFAALPAGAVVAVSSVGGVVAPQTALLVQVANEKEVEAAKAFVDRMAQAGIGFLGNEALTEAQRKAEFRKLLNSSFDMDTIGRFALGRNWRTATSAQKAEYQKLFKAMIVSVYSRRFSDYKGEKLEVGSARIDGNNDVVVSSSIVPANGEKVQVDWRVRGKGGSYKVVDILVAGVSMALTQRSDFDSVIQRGGGNVEALLEHLRKQ